jgi:hypothetical protein
MGIETVITVVALAASAVGAGVSYSAQQSAAADNAQLALLNAQGQTQAAKQQGELGAMQAQLNQQLNKQLSDRDQAAAEQNARTLEAQAKLGTEVTQGNIQKTREEFARMLAAQRVQAAKAGVADTTGSPLELLAKTAADEQRTANQMRYEDENNRRGLFGGAFEQRDQAKINAQLSKIDGLSMASQGAAARGTALNQIAQAKLDLYAARAQSDGMRQQATAGLISSAGSMASGLYSTYRATPRRNAPYAAGFNANGNPIAARA